jgi:hypothetical protein
LSSIRTTSMRSPSAPARVLVGEPAARSRAR